MTELRDQQPMGGPLDALLADAATEAVSQIAEAVAQGLRPDSSLVSSAVLMHVLALAYFEPEYIPALVESVICHRRGDPEDCGVRSWARGFVGRYPLEQVVPVSS